MSYWFYPKMLSASARQAMLENNEFIVPADGMADLSRAQSVEQVADWLRRVYPDAIPEEVNAQAQHFWRVAHEVTPEDMIVVRSEPDGNYLIGEVIAPYHRESRELGMAHVLPVRWSSKEIPAGVLAVLATTAASDSYIHEVADEKALIQLKSHIPGLKGNNVKLFRWIAITTLIFELIYFWPRS